VISGLEYFINITFFKGKKFVGCDAPAHRL